LFLRDLVGKCKVHHNAYMPKAASLTVRIPEPLKRQIEARAAREHRSLSAQVEHELARLFATEQMRGPRGPLKAGRLLGRYAGKRIPTTKELREVREGLWSRLAGDAR
jgi:plasmid stability protein